MKRSRLALQQLHFLPMLLGGLILLGLAGGCNTTSSTSSTSANDGMNNTVSDSRLRVGDQVQIRLETSTQQPPQGFDMMIDEKGGIALPLVGWIEAQGKTTGQLRDSIEKAYVPRYYKRCNVNVLVASRYFYVGGEVRAPGRYPWAQDITLMKAINTAGGFNDYANRTNVELTRAKQKTVYNCETIRQRPSEDVATQPGDSIYVPRSIF